MTLLGSLLRPHALKQDVLALSGGNANVSQFCVNSANSLAYNFQKFFFSCHLLFFFFGSTKFHPMHPQIGVKPKNVKDLYADLWASFSA